MPRSATRLRLVRAPGVARWRGHAQQPLPRVNLSPSATGGGGKAGMDVRRGVTADMHICKICRATFPSTCKQPQLAEHSDSKHSKNTFAECFDLPA